MKVLLFLLFAFTHLCGVVRRDDVSDATYIEFGRDPRFNCVGQVVGNVGSATGTLIDPYTVLTVAHIVQRDHEVITFELYDPILKKMIATKGKIQIHENFLYTKKENHFIDKIHNDIALIHLDSPIFFVTPAKILYQLLEHQFQFVSAGFGTTGTGITLPSLYDRQKRGYENKVTTFLLPSWHDECYSTYFDPPSSPLCLPLEGIGARGDSGSGIFVNVNEEFYLIGFTHVLAGKGDYLSYNLILPIANFQTWIEENLHHNRY